MRWLHRFVMLIAALALSGCGAAPAPTGLPDRTAGPPPGETAEAERLAQEREDMVQDTIVGRGVADQRVIEAMRRIPRHLFVPEDFRSLAYSDDPLPIGYGQTISQPYIVALMTEALELESDDVVLEIGTGSGYQAAVLAELAGQVYSVEIIGALADQAQQRLAALGYDRIAIKHADGYFGWPEHAPFDAIIVTAAPDHIPAPLLEQLADGGRLVIPVGPVGAYQELYLVERQGGQFVTSSLGGVAFVPLTRVEK